MKKIQLILGTVAALVLAGFGLSACGPLGECSTDADCPGTESCLTSDAVTENQCVTSCGTVENPQPDLCDEGEECEPANDSSNSMACAPSDNGGDQDTGMMTDAGDTGGGDTGGGDMDAGPECMDNDDCMGEDNICNPQGECEMISTEDEHFFIQFKDVTLDENPGSEAEACEGDAADDPGSDLFAIELQDSEGGHKGWAFYVANHNPGMSNTHTEYATIFDGSEPSLTPMGGEQCVDFGSDTIASLGCENGAMVAGFKTGPDAQDFVTLEEGDRLVVHEYGDQCGGSDVDRLNAQVCTNQAATDFQGLVDSDFDSEGNFPSCANMSLGSGGANFTLPVTDLPPIDGGS